MHQTEAHRTRATGILSAMLLFLATALAGAYGPLTAGAPLVSSMPGSAAGGVAAPVTPMRPFVAVDWRADKDVGHQGGSDAEPALPPAGFGLPDFVLELPDDALSLRPEPPLATHGFDARAPPAFS